MKRPFILYHWSPASRRKSIMRNGLIPGKKPVQSSQAFPYLCWSDSPSLAWALSGVYDNTGQEWDLWMTWSNRLGKLEKRRDLGFPTEYRNFQRVPKKDMWLVGSRMAKKSKGRK